MFHQRHLLLCALLSSFCTCGHGTRTGVGSSSRISVISSHVCAAFDGSHKNASVGGGDSTAASLAVERARSPPHLVVMLADDLGWNDLGGFHGAAESSSSPRAPHCSELMDQGVRLFGLRVWPLCSPTRGALLTGRYPIRWGGHSWVANPAHRTWLPASEVTLAERLSAHGYHSHMVGKWHLGQSDNTVIPTGQGFETFYGLYMGGGDHYWHTFGRSYEPGSFGSIYSASRDIWPVETLDLHRELRSAADGPGRRVHDFSRNGTHSSALFADEAVAVIAAHTRQGAKGEVAGELPPLFLYVAWQAPHSPIQADDAHVARNDHIQGKRRQVFAGLVTSMDEAVGRIVSALKLHGLWDNTLLLFLSDNGGDVSHAASNWPLRGAKSSMFEGGMRSVSFLSGGVIPTAQRGGSYAGTLSVVDLVPTLLSAAGLGSNEDLSNIDGIDLWPHIIHGLPSPRDGEETDAVPTLLGLDPVERGVCKASGGNMMCPGKALRVGRWKLVTGLAGRGDWYGRDTSDVCTGDGWYTAPDETNYASSAVDLGDGGQATLQQAVSSGDAEKVEESWAALRRSPRLFDLATDPEERVDLSSQQPERLQRMLAQLAAFDAQAEPPHPNPSRADILRAASRRLPDGRPVLDVWPPMPLGGFIE